jgi:hypothetical protein
MIYHILNGDSLAYSLPSTHLEGEIIVDREALVDGDLQGKDLSDFWKSRAAYIGISSTEYYEKVVAEFDKILTAPEGTEFNLWFEYDLFCQVNLWFVLSLITDLTIKKRVYTVQSTYLTREDKNFWNAFGPATPDQLIQSFNDRILLSDRDIQLGKQLWNAYKNANFTELKSLSKNQTHVFPYLREVIEAHIDRFPKGGEKGRPEKVLEEIIHTHPSDFQTVFQEFWKRESIYGFGDVQLKHLYDKVPNTSF